MATPWDRIDDDFRSWLTQLGTTADDYNNRTSPTERGDLLNSFNRGVQQVQQQVQLQVQQQVQVQVQQQQQPQQLAIP